MRPLRKKLNPTAGKAEKGSIGKRWEWWVWHRDKGFNLVSTVQLKGQVFVMLNNQTTLNHFKALPTFNVTYNIYNSTIKNKQICE